MEKKTSPMSVDKIMDHYFLEHRAKLLDLASFFDRINRAQDFNAEKLDFRYEAILGAIAKLAKFPSDSDRSRVEQMHLHFSDKSTEPLESAKGLQGAYGTVEK